MADDESAAATHPADGDAPEGRDSRDGTARNPVRARRKASLLWGLVGGMAFLVLIQGYELLADAPVVIGVKAGVALLVAIGAAALTRAAYARLSSRT